ncbi:MAG: FAD-binding oxidoreductase [Candidatus Doudnabacteria bacterium]
MSLSQLKQKFKGQISTNEALLEKYSTDASVFKIAPKVIAIPKDTKDVEELVKFVAQQKQTSPELSITVRGGGTDMTGGSINESIIVDTVNLNKVESLNQQSLTAQPGLFFRDIETKLIAQNTILPCYPSSKSWCTLGGMASNNAGGEKTLRYGQSINFVEELEVILADGNTYTIKPLTQTELTAKLAQTDFEGQLYQQVFRLVKDNYKLLQQAKPTTSKNASGYYLWDVWDGTTFDLTKLFVGSQGTLGIITKIKWRLVPLKRNRQLTVFYLETLKNLGEIVAELRKLDPESVEVFDNQTFKIALRYLPEIGLRTKQSTWSLIWKFKKEILQWLIGRLPQIILLTEFTGTTPEEVEQQAQKAQQIIKEQFNISSLLPNNTTEANRFWSIRRESYNLLRHHTARKLSAAFIEDIVVHPDQLPKFIPQIKAIIDRYPAFTYTIAGHAGDANFHIIPLVDLSNPKHRKELISLSDEVFNLVKKYQGSMTAEHNDGLVRGPFLEQMFGSQVLSLFKQVKTIFDPQNIFNPHKKSDASIEYYRDHVRSH